MHIATLRLLLLLILTAAASSVRAHTGSIRGIVYDGSTHKPLEGATIFIKANAAGTVSDAFGKFLLKGVEPGSYKVQISHLAYDNIEEEIKVEEGVTTEASFTLLPAPVKMESVSVSARKDIGTACISGLDLKMRPVNNTQDLLRLVPGLFTAQHQGGGKAEQLFLRGFDCDHGTDINVSVDNMPVNMVSHAHGQGFADTHFIIPESVQEVDYGKGPFQVSKGNLCTAGYVALKTRNSLDESFVKVDGGMYGYFRTAAGINLINSQAGVANRQSAYIMGEYGYNRGYFDLPQNFNRLNLMGKYTNYLSADKVLTLTLSGFSSSWDASGQVPERAISNGTISSFGDIDPEAGATSRYNINLQYIQSINASSSIKSDFYLTYYKFRLYSNFTYFAVDSVNGDQIRQAESRTIAGYNGEYTTGYTAAHLRMKTQAGLGFRYDNITDDELSNTMGQTVLIKTKELGDIHEANIFGYVGQSVYLTPRLVMNVGTRYDAFVQQYISKLPSDKIQNSFTHARFSPKAGLSYDLSSTARLYYSYGTGFHTNDTRTLALGRQYGGNLIVNNTIPAAYAHDLGLILKPTPGLLLSVAIWQLSMQQEFTYSGDVAVIDTSGRTQRYGVDCSARYQLFKWLYLDADINYAHARSIDQPSGHNYIPLAPSLTSIGGATFRLRKDLSASLRYRYMSNRPANKDNSRTALGYTVCDAVISYIRPHYEFGIQVQNLFNVQWREAQFDTQTRLLSEVASHSPAVTEVCYTPGTPFFLKFSAAYKF